MRPRIKLTLILIILSSLMTGCKSPLYIPNMLVEGYIVEKVAFMNGEEQLQMVLYVSKPTIGHLPAGRNSGGAYSGQDICYVTGRTFLYVVKNDQIISEFNLGEMMSIIGKEMKENEENIELVDANGDGIKHEFIIRRRGGATLTDIWLIGYIPKTKSLKNLLGKGGNIIDGSFINTNGDIDCFENGYMYVLWYDMVEKGEWAIDVYKWDKINEVFEFINLYYRNEDEDMDTFRRRVKEKLKNE